MKTLNSNAKTSVVRMTEDNEKQPCWYADMDKGDTLKEHRWSVGVVYPDGKKDEYSFKCSKAGKDRSLLERMLSSDFGIRLLHKFRQGGRKAVKQWLDQGCP